MNREIIHHTIILLLDGKSATDNKLVKNWLRKSRFLTNETTDIFQALEEISDFTVRSRPDVVLLEVNSLKEEFSIIQKMMQSLSGKCEYLIFALTDSGKIINDKKCFEGNLAQVKVQLDKMIPKAAHAAAGM